MNNDWLSQGYIIVGGMAIAFLTYFIVKKQLSVTRFKRFLGILAIATASSLIPFGPFGLAFGFPSVLIASILVACFLDKENE